MKQSTSFSRIRRVAAAGLTAAFVASAGLVASTPPAARADEVEQAPGYRIVGRVPIPFDGTSTVHRRRSTGWLLADPANRFGLLVTESGFIGNQKTHLQVVDLDTLALGRRVVIAGLLPLYSGMQVPSGADIVHAVDAEGGRLFLAMTDTDSIAETGGTQPLRRIIVIDERRLLAGGDDWRRDLTSVAASPYVRTRSLHGLEHVRDERGSHLLLQMAAYTALVRDGTPGTDPAQPTVHDNWLVQWDAEADTPGWAHLLDLCLRAPMRVNQARPAFQLPMLVERNAVHLVCQAAHWVVQVVTVHLGADGSPTSATPGPPLPRKYADVLLDPGARRFLVKTVDLGVTWWAFDMGATNWAGAVGVLPGDGSTTAGLDPDTGRLYALTPHSVYSGKNALERLPWRGGLLAADTRLTPASQAANVVPGLVAPGFFKILVDPAAPGRPRRLFVRRGFPNSNSTYDYPGLEANGMPAPFDFEYLVVEDTTPVAQPGAADQVDRLTTDIDEAPGVTGANFTGAAAGYGARVQLVGGVSAAVDGRLDSTNSPCVPTDRDVAAGSVQATELTNVLASARSRPLAVDGNTRADWAAPDRRCWSRHFPPRANDGGPSDEPDESGLGDRAAVCTADSRESEPHADDALGRGGAEASCEQAAGAVTARARHVASELVAGVRVGEAWTETSVKRVPGTGMVATVTSVAKDVEIDGVGTIGVVRTVATATAGGRKRTASSSIERTVCGIAASGLGRTGCLSDPEAVAALLNRLLGTRGRVRLPEPEPALRGTPGGYLAAVQKRASEEFSDSVINRDASKAVPGLEIIRYNDDPHKGAARQIVQLAGAEVSTTYGIYLLAGFGADTSDGDAPDGDVADDGGPSFATGLDPLTGLPPGVAAISSGGRALGTDLLSRLFGRPLVLRTLADGLLAAAVWLVLGLPAWTAARRRAFLGAFSGKDST